MAECTRTRNVRAAIFNALTAEVVAQIDVNTVRALMTNDNAWKDVFTSAMNEGTRSAITNRKVLISDVRENTGHGDNFGSPLP